MTDIDGPYLEALIDGLHEMGIPDCDAAADVIDRLRVRSVESFSEWWGMQAQLAQAEHDRNEARDWLAMAEAAVREAQAERDDARHCPCTPDAPTHIHGIGGYARKSADGHHPSLGAPVPLVEPGEKR